MNQQQIDVSVIAFIAKNGKMKPLYIVWENEYTGETTNYKIEKITYHVEQPMHHQIWTVVINGQQRSLHYDGKKWYIVRQ